MNTQTATVELKDLFITVTAEFDTDSNAYDSLADCMSKKQIKALLEKAETNEWYWSSILVTAEYMDEDGNEYTAEDSLGACSYKSRMDFINNSGYYEDMVNGLLEDINRQLA